ncbi:MAG: TolC family protein [Rhizobacter sp.]|nr:TolC family protein [Ferruginibacter sp.]
MMKAYLYLPFLILFAAFQSVQVYAQDTENKPLPSVWTIEQCIDYAKQHNIQVNTLQLNRQSAEQDLIAAQGSKIPSLSAAVASTFNNANNNAAGNGTLVNQLVNSETYSVTSSIVLWNDHYINNNIRQQNLLTQSASLSVLQTQNNLTLSITQAYLNILLAKENEQYITDLVNTTTASVHQGQMLFDAGSIAKTSLLQLQAQLASDNYLLVQVQNTIRQNILALKQLLQLPSQTPFDITKPASIKTSSTIDELQIAQQTALNNFPEIKMGKLGVDIAALDIAKAKANFKPVLKASGAFGSGYNDVFTNNTSPKTGYFAQTGNNFYQNLGVTLSIPIFSQRVNKTNLEKTNIAYKQANLNLQNNQLILTQAVEQAYLNTINARQAYDAANQQLISAIESYRIVNAELKLGAINSYDLLQQRNQYVQAVQVFTQAKYIAVLQQKIYEFYIGKPVTL